MLITFEISRPVQFVPGVFRSKYGFVSFRAWWLWFAVSVEFIDAYEKHMGIRSGRITWQDK